MASVKDIDALLPQTQCMECGFKGCMPYAEALANGQADIDLCPPGGVETLKQLAALLGRDPSAYIAAVEVSTRAPAIADIREAECIGCTKCIQACPVDAIIGSAKQMHGVIGDECTGCGLCVEPCPVDCIDMLPQKKVDYDKNKARARFQAREARLRREQQEKQQAYRKKRLLVSKETVSTEDKLAKQDYIRQALARVQSKHHE